MPVTRTIRLPDDIDRGLQALAKKEKVSVNFLVNGSVLKLIEWDETARKFGFVSIQSDLLRRLMDRLTDTQAKELGRWFVLNRIRARIVFTSRQITVNSVLAWLETSSRYQRLFEIDHTDDKGHYVLALKHSMGTKGSLFLDAMIHSIFEDLLAIKVQTNCLEDLCLATFEATS